MGWCRLPHPLRPGPPEDMVGPARPPDGYDVQAAYAQPDAYAQPEAYSAYMQASIAQQASCQGHCSLNIPAMRSSAIVLAVCCMCRLRMITCSLSDPGTSLAHPGTQHSLQAAQAYRPCTLTPCKHRWHDLLQQPAAMTGHCQQLQLHAFRHRSL